jgi:hypothetical protein
MADFQSDAFVFLGAVWVGTLSSAYGKAQRGGGIIARRTARNRETAQRMLAQGYSYRQIMRHLGHKRTSSVNFLLGKRNGTKKKS